MTKRVLQVPRCLSVLRLTLHVSQLSIANHFEAFTKFEIAQIGFGVLLTRRSVTHSSFDLVEARIGPANEWPAAATTGRVFGDSSHLAASHIVR